MQLHYDMSKFAAKLRRRQLDKTLHGYKIVPQPPRGFIHEIRTALEMSTYQFASRVGVHQSTVVAMEESERNGAISLKNLERAADALGCKLVYALVPNNSLEEQVSDQARRKARDLFRPVKRTMALEKQSTEYTDQEELIAEIAAEILRKGGRELWKIDTICE